MPVICMAKKASPNETAADTQTGLPSSPVRVVSSSTYADDSRNSLVTQTPMMALMTCPPRTCRGCARGDSIVPKHRTAPAPKDAMIKGVPESTKMVVDMTISMSMIATMPPKVEKSQTSYLSGMCLSQENGGKGRGA